MTSVESVTETVAVDVLLGFGVADAEDENDMEIETVAELLRLGESVPDRECVEVTCVDCVLVPPVAVRICEDEALWLPECVLVDVSSEVRDTESEVENVAEIDFVIENSCDRVTLEVASPVRLAEAFRVRDGVLERESESVISNDNVALVCVRDAVLVNVCDVVTDPEAVGSRVPDRDIETVADFTSEWVSVCESFVEETEAVTVRVLLGDCDDEEVTVTLDEDVSVPDAVESIVAERDVLA